MVIAPQVAKAEWVAITPTDIYGQYVDVQTDLTTRSGNQVELWSRHPQLRPDQDGAVTHLSYKVIYCSQREIVTLRTIGSDPNNQVVFDVEFTGDNLNPRSPIPGTAGGYIYEYACQ